MNAATFIFPPSEPDFEGREMYKEGTDMCGFRLLNSHDDVTFYSLDGSLTKVQGTQLVNGLKEFNLAPWYKKIDCFENYRGGGDDHGGLDSWGSRCLVAHRIQATVN